MNSAYRAILAMLVLLASASASLATYPFGLSAPSVVPASENFQATVTEFDIPSTNVGSYSAAYTTVISNPASNTATYYLWLVTEDPSTGKIELEVTTTTSGKGLKKSTSSTIEHLETTSNINALAPGQSMTLSIKVKPTAAGTWTGWVGVGESSGKDIYLAYRVVGTTPPATPAPPLYKAPSRALIDYGAESYNPVTDTVAVRLLSTAQAFQEGSVVWYVDGVLISTDRHPAARLKAGIHNLRLEIREKDTGKLYPAEETRVFPTPEPSQPAVFDPGPSGYHPQPGSQAINHASGRVETTAPVAAIDNGRVWKKRRAKEAAVENVTWGWAKNSRQE